MRIYFERTGGLMGMRIAATVDTQSLPAEDALNLHEMIDAVSFFDLPENPLESSEGADQFLYKLVVEDEERQHTVLTADSVAPEALRPLLRLLTILTRSTQS
jgi:hypothetical protein